MPNFNQGTLQMKFVELVDIEELRGLCESFTTLTGAVTAILDTEGNILIATGWQQICTHFHRMQPWTAARCRESDTVLASRLRQGEAYNVYKCKNGLVDVAVPITIGGEHVANLFTGQFFFESPNKDLFIRQAKEFGFGEKTYLAALEKVPVFSEARVREMMGFLTHLAQLMGEMGLAKLRLKEANAILQAREADYRHQAATDFLTELPSRRSFFTRLGDELARFKRSDVQPVALLMIDLDHFKETNDRFGHIAGDALLKHFGVLLTTGLRRIDMAGRVGGDEFGIILPGTSAQAALLFARRLVERIASSPLSFHGQDLGMTVSIGVTELSITDPSLDSALARADKALYRAKAMGRNRVGLAEVGDEL